MCEKDLCRSNKDKKVKMTLSWFKVNPISNGKFLEEKKQTQRHRQTHKMSMVAEIGVTQL
jgi:hypothetical protein